MEILLPYAHKSFQKYSEITGLAIRDLASVRGFTINFLKDLGKVGKFFTQLHWTVHNSVLGNNTVSTNLYFIVETSSPSMDCES